MKRLPLLLLCTGLLATSALGEGWQDELSPTQPGSFPPLHPLHAQFKFGWSAFTAAEATFDYSKYKGGLMRMDVSAKSTGFVRTLWRMDAQHTALMQPSTLHPVSVRQTEVYHNQSVKTKLDFTSSGVTRLRETNPNDGKPPKPKHFDFPDLLDLNSTLHWMRSQKLAGGDVYKFVVYPTTSPYLAEVDVGERQKISVGGRNWNAIKLNLKLWRINDRLELEPHTKFKNAAIWISDDTNRMLLKIEAEIFVGSVWAELQSIDYK